LSHAQKPRLAVVSPSLDKAHGTERLIVEWVSELARTFEIHIYSQRVEDLDPSKFIWHRIPRLPGPHLANFLWWFAANALWRAWDRRFRGLQFDIVYSPGPNCLDADAISVHIVFAEYAQRVWRELRLSGKPPWVWPRLIHRRLYYRLAILLERSAYTRPDIRLILIARRTEGSLANFYGRREHFPVIYIGIDHTSFNSTRRLGLRGEARKTLALDDTQFNVLLIGNDLRNKGLPILLRALAELRGLPIHLLAVSREDPVWFRSLITEHGLEERIHLLPPRGDVIFYYASADAYAGPSLEDTFALPPAEAMACGLPVIVSSQNGTCEIITDGTDGLILSDPTDSKTLAAMIRRLYENREYRDQLGKNAEKTARQYTWASNGRALAAIFEEILRRKARPTAQPLAQERDA
jgi:glycosyltransferase involved in cell wall biosynthesis